MNRRRPGRLPRWQEFAVYLSFGLLVAGGIAWLLLDNFVRVAGAFGPEHHPGEQIALILHGVIAYAFLIVVGAMIPVHMIAGWNVGRNLKSGIAVVAVVLLLAITALGLYYLGDESVRLSAGLIHWLVGLVAVPLLLIHALGGRRGS